MAKRTGLNPDQVKVREQISRIRAEDVVDVFSPGNGWKMFRPIGNIFAYGVHWVTTKKRDGTKGRFTIPCSAFDPDTGERDSTKKCAFCDHMHENPPVKGKESEVSFSVSYWFNIIDRSLQDKAPSKLPRLEPQEKETGIKDKESDSWTPVRAMRLSGNDLKKLTSLKELNVVKKKGAAAEPKSVFDDRYGCDVNYKFKASEKVPANRHEFQRSERSPLTEEESAYLVYDLSELETEMTEEDVKTEYSNWYKRNHEGEGVSKADRLKESKKASAKALQGALDDDEDDDGDDDGDDEDVPLPKNKSKAKTKSNKVEPDDDFADDEDDDEDIPPPKSKSKPPVKKKPPVIDDDEDDDDFSEDDDKPPVKSKPPVKKKPPVIDDDDDDEDGDGDDDDLPPAKSKSKPPVKKKPTVIDDDEDDDGDDDLPPPKFKPPVKKKPPVLDDDDDGDDDEDIPPPKSKSKPPVKKKPPVIDDDEDDDGDDDEDIPPPKSKSKPPVKKVLKKKPAELDDDDIPL